jgi:hypothetical protein
MPFAESEAPMREMRIAAVSLRARAAPTMRVGRLRPVLRKESPADAKRAVMSEVSIREPTEA